MSLRQKQSRPTRLPVGRGLATVLAVCACAGLLASPVAAHTTAATDTAHLHLISSPGSLLLEEGTASGTLPGWLKVRFDVGPTVSAKFAIYTKGGTIQGHGAGKLRSAGLYSTFGGWLQITGGTGRYAHARGSGGLYGAINRRNDSLTIKTTGKISY